MKSFEKELARGLTAIADAMDPDAPQRLLSQIDTRSHRSRFRPRYVALIGGAAAAASVVATLNVAGLLGADPTSTPTPRGSVGLDGKADSLLLPTKPGEPCPDAHKFSLGDLAARADAPIWLPHSDLASPATLTGAWTCAGGDTPVLTFGKLVVTYEPGWTGVDVNEKWGELVDELGEGYVQTIQGQHALVQPVTKASPRGQVLLVVDGVLIRVLGDGSLPVDQLVDVAQSINLERPVRE
jgi:hypothetical protein